MKTFKVIFFFVFATNNIFCQNTLLEKAKTFYNIDSTFKYAELNVINAIKSKDTMLQIESYLLLSNHFNLQSLYSKSEEACKKALNLSVALKSNALIGSCYSGFANLYNYKNDNVAALNFYLKAKDFIEKGNDVKKKLKSLIDLAEFYRKLTKYNEAQYYLANGFKFYNNFVLNDTAQLIRLYNRLAAVKYEENEIDSSLFFSFKAIKLCEQSNDKNGEATSYNEIGAVYRNKNDLKKSSYYFIKARDIWLELKNYRYALEAMMNLAILYDQHNLPKTFVVTYFNDIVDLTNEHHIDFPLANVYGYLHKMYIKEGDTSKAYVNLLGIKNSDESYMFKKLNSELEDIKAKYENESIKKEVETISNNLKNQKRETFLIYVVTLILFILMAIIAYLLYSNIKKNKILQSQNTYKDVLIQEVHHRVKNNLQLIISLINLQKKASHNSMEVDTLNDTSRRINSMSLVHEMLYNQDSKGVQIQNYINELIQSINEMVNTKNIPIEFNLTITDVIVAPNKAIALGMITSELVSNSIKYAFSNQPKPIIKITFHKGKNSDQFVYSVSDNGIGCIINENKESTLGMRLINIFSRQLKGDFKFENNQGLIYNIQFSL